MASIGIIISSLVGISLILDANCSKFVTLNCPKSEVTAEYGTNTILFCEIKTQQQKSTKIVSVTWSVKNKKIPVLVFYNGTFPKKEKGFEFAEKQWDETVMNVSLLITNTDLSHAGKYECGVMTDSGVDKAEVDLTVKANYSKPVISSNPEKIKPNEHFTLTCEAHGGYPKGDLRWFANNKPWLGKPDEEPKTKEDTGLWALSSKLTFAETQFTTFTCAVYNSEGIKEGEETFPVPKTDTLTDNNGSKPSPSQIVAPVVVIGSLIVGLLLLLLLRRRRQRKARRPSAAPLMSGDRTEVPPDDFDEEEGDPKVVSLQIDNSE